MGARPNHTNYLVGLIIGLIISSAIALCFLVPFLESAYQTQVSIERARAAASRVGPGKIDIFASADQVCLLDPSGRTIAKKTIYLIDKGQADANGFEVRFHYSRTNVELIAPDGSILFVHKLYNCNYVDMLSSFKSLSGRMNVAESFKGYEKTDPPSIRRYKLIITGDPQSNYIGPAFEYDN